MHYFTMHAHLMSSMALFAHEGGVGQTNATATPAIALGARATFCPKCMRIHIGNWCAWADLPRSGVAGSTATVEWQAAYRYWESQGCSVRACTALSFAGCGSISDVRSRGQNYFKTVKNCGKVTLVEIGTLVGGWSDFSTRGLDEARPEPAAEKRPEPTQDGAPVTSVSSNGLRGKGRRIVCDTAAGVLRVKSSAAEMHVRVEALKVAIEEARRLVIAMANRTQARDDDTRRAL